MVNEPTKLETARHEAAHFVVAWAVEYPMEHVDITPKARSVDEDDPNWVILGYNKTDTGCAPPFEDILISLAGPVADHWGADNAKILEDGKNLMDDLARFIAETKRLQSGSHDWQRAVTSLFSLGCDAAILTEREKWLNLFIDGVRAILRLCETQWQEVTEHLVEYGRIGYYGSHNPPLCDLPPLPPALKDMPRPDQGEEAEKFFFKWGEDWGVPPEAVKSCVGKIRAAIQAAGIKTP